MLPVESFHSLVFMCMCKDISAIRDSTLIEQFYQTSKNNVAYKKSAFVYVYFNVDVYMEIRFTLRKMWSSNRKSTSKQAIIYVFLVLLLIFQINSTPKKSISHQSSIYVLLLNIVRSNENWTSLYRYVSGVFLRTFFCPTKRDS